MPQRTLTPRRLPSPRLTGQEGQEVGELGVNGNSSLLGMDLGTAMYDMIAMQWPEYESVVAGDKRGAVPSMIQRDVLAQVQVR